MVIFTVLLAGCSDAAGNGETSYEKVSIVLKNGNVVDEEDFTSALKPKAMAVVVRPGRPYESGLIVGIHHNKSGLLWCNSSAGGYNKDIQSLQNISDGGYALTALVLASSDADPDSGNLPGLYPAWNFCQTYGTTYCAGTSFTAGWYLPSVRELQMIYRNLGAINRCLAKAGGDTFGSTDTYWSCMQSSKGAVYAKGVFFANGTDCSGSKNSSSPVCAVRKF